MPPIGGVQSAGVAILHMPEAQLLTLYRGTAISSGASHMMRLTACAAVVAEVRV